MVYFLRFSIFLMMVSFVSAQNTSDIEVTILNIQSDKGQVLVGLYNSEDTWLNTPFRGIFGEIKDRKCVVTFSEIPFGVYGVSAFHDKDSDGELDTFLGVPTEDTGSSNDAPAKFGPPKWEVAKIEVSEKITKQTIHF